MRVFLTCLALDQDHPILSHMTEWVRQFSNTPGIENITVVSPLIGRFEPKENIRVRSIGRSSRFATLFAFYKEVFAAQRQGIDAFFVCQGGPYPGLLFPVRLLTGKPVFVWWEHSLIPMYHRLCARYCDTRVFTATESSFPLPLANRRVVGHGINTDTFRPIAQGGFDGLVTVARVSPIKKIERMIDLVAIHRNRSGTVVPLHIYGPTEQKDIHYHRELENQVERLGLENAVHFHGAVPRSQLPWILSRHKVFLHFCPGALDKAVLEAMACGVPVLSDNVCVAEALPTEMCARLVFPEASLESAADRLQALLALDEAETAHLANDLRANIIAHHDLGRLFNRIYEEMNLAIREDGTRK